MHGDELGKAKILFSGIAANHLFYPLRRYHNPELHIPLAPALIPVLSLLLQNM